MIDARPAARRRRQSEGEGGRRDRGTRGRDHGQAGLRGLAPGDGARTGGQGGAGPGGAARPGRGRHGDRRQQGWGRGRWSPGCAASVPFRSSRRGTWRTRASTWDASSSSASRATTSTAAASIWWSRGGRCSRKRRAAAPRRCAPSWCRARSCPGWWRASRISAPSSTWAASRACCTPPSWAFRAMRARARCLAVGQRLDVQVLKIEKTGDAKRPERISLSLKSLERDPWEDVRTRFPVGNAGHGQGGPGRAVRRLRRAGARASRGWCTPRSWPGASRCVTRASCASPATAWW